VATYHDVDTKSQVRSPERPTSHNKNIVSARPDAFEARGKYEDDGAPNAYSDRTLAHPKSGLSGNNNDVPYGGRHRRYVGNTSQRLNTNYDDEVVKVEMTKNAKRIISQADRGLALTKDVKNSNLQRSYGILCNHIIGSATNNVAHGGALSPDTDDASAKHFRTSSKQPK